jgi:hypothetical protein
LLIEPTVRTLARGAKRAIGGGGSVPKLSSASVSSSITGVPCSSLRRATSRRSLSGITLPVGFW